MSSAIVSFDIYEYIQYLLKKQYIFWLIDDPRLS